MTPTKAEFVARLRAERIKRQKAKQCLYLDYKRDMLERQRRSHGRRK